MKGEILIGIDAGTSVIKAVAFDLSGREVAAAHRRNHYHNLANGGVEQEMNRTWHDTIAVVREVVESVGPERVSALGVTGQGDGTWLIDNDDQPIHDGWLWLDARATEEAREITNSQHIDEIYRTTGAGVNVCQMRTHLSWMKKHAAGLLERAAVAFHCKDWLYLKLTGIRATDPTEGVISFGDFRHGNYAETVFEALNLGHVRHLMPDIVDGAEMTHGLTSEAARAVGLPTGIPVALGYVDVLCTALGAGLYDSETMPGFSVLGSTGMHMRFAPDPESIQLNPDLTGYVMAFPGQARAQMQTNMAATLNIDWIVDIAKQMLLSQGFSVSAEKLLSDFDDKLLSARLGRAIYHPYIAKAGERGPFIEPAARASLTNLDQSTDWFDLVRSVYDGLVLATRDCYSAMGEIPGEVRLCGGGTRSAALRKLLASALNRPVRTVDQEEAGAAGAVMIAGIATGLFADAATATKSWVLPLLQDAEMPDPTLVSPYDCLFEAYKESRTNLPPVWAAQAALRESLP